jgi:hypothetical protein
MLRDWLLRQRLSTPAPIDARPPGSTVGPPDGWEVLDPSWWERMTGRADRLLLRVADTAAQGLSRRDFLKRAAQFGMATGLILTRALWWENAALADTLYECNHFGTGGNPGPCGTSEECPSSSCNSNHDCNLNQTCNNRTTRSQDWSLATCAGAAANNSWRECCGCSGGVGNQWRCHDCCSCRQLSSGTCAASSCPNNKQRWKCICEENLNTTCTTGC